MKNLLVFVALGMLFASCKKEKSLQNYMVNSWETTYLKIEMPTFQNSDSTSVFEDRFQNNPPQRAQSEYKSDGTFEAWFVDKEGNKKGTSPGTWSVKGDTLHIEYFYGGRDVKVNYHIQKTATGFKGTSKYDWDEDGNYDDLLIMETKKIQ